MLTDLGADKNFITPCEFALVADTVRRIMSMEIAHGLVLSSSSSLTLSTIRGLRCIAVLDSFEWWFCEVVEMLVQFHATTILCRKLII